MKDKVIKERSLKDILQKQFKKQINKRESRAKTLNVN
jgi:hypothetical protein